MRLNAVSERGSWLNYAPVQPPLIIIGLGNPILGDDGVGWQVAATIAERLNINPNNPDDRYTTITYRSESIEIDCLAVGGLALMERLVGYDRAIIIDAINTGHYPPGKVLTYSVESLPEYGAGHLSSTHDTTFQNALKIGRAMGARLPEQIEIVGIEAQIAYEFSEQLSPPISKSVPEAVKLVMELLQ